MNLKYLLGKRVTRRLYLAPNHGITVVACNRTVTPWDIGCLLRHNSVTEILLTIDIEGDDVLFHRSKQFVTAHTIFPYEWTI